MCSSKAWGCPNVSPINEYVIRAVSYKQSGIIWKQAAHIGWVLSCLVCKVINSSEMEMGIDKLCMTPNSLVMLWMISALSLSRGLWYRVSFEPSELITEQKKSSAMVRDNLPKLIKYCILNKFWLTGVVLLKCLVLKQTQVMGLFSVNWVRKSSFLILPYHILL